MFNQGAFNQIAFNRKIPANIYTGALLLLGEGVLTLLPSQTIFASITFTGAGALSLNMTKSGAITFTGTGIFEASPSMVANAGITFAGTGTFEAIPRAIFNTSLELSGVGTFNLHSAQWAVIEFAGSGALEQAARVIRWGELPLSGVGTLILLDPTILTYTGLVFSGDIPPANLLKIDTERFTADLNGIDVTHLLSGFFDLNPGLNELSFSDQNFKLDFAYRSRYL